MAHLTIDERQRVEYLLPAVESLVGRLVAAGVANPVAVLHAAVDAGRDASEAPILALSRQVPPEALYWAPEIEYLRIVNDMADGVRLGNVLHVCLDLIARGGLSAPRA